MGSVLSFDKTYNLGSMYVIVAVYRNQTSQRATREDIPIFIGPIFLHGNYDFATYADFFSHLSARLETYDFSKLRPGSDEEAFIRNAMQHAFPRATLVCCILHMKDNLRRHAHKVNILLCSYAIKTLKWPTDFLARIRDFVVTGKT